MALSERLELDLNDALRGVSRVDDALDQMSKRFKSSLAAAFDVLAGVRVTGVDVSDVTRQIDRAVADADLEPEVTADADSVTDAIDDAVADADLEPDVTADAGSVTDAIDDAVGDADTDVEIEGDASSVSDAIDDAIADADPSVDIDADASDVTDAIDDAVGGADTSVDIDLDVDTSDATDAIDDLTSSAADGEDGLGRLEGATGRAGGAASVATGDFSGLADALGATSGGAAIAAGAIVSVTAVAANFFDSALEADTAARRFNNGLGELADEASRVNLGGLNEDLADLALRTGNSDEALLLAAGRIGEMGRSAGLADEEIVRMVSSVNALAIRATVMNPTLGQAGDVADALSNALARGGKALTSYGIDLSSAEIEARALANTGKSTAAELTVVEKAAAGAELAVEKLGGSLAGGINAGAEGAEIRLRSLNESVGEMAEAFGQPIIEPVLQAFQNAQPILFSLGETFGEIAERALPLLIRALDAVEPSIDAAADVVLILLTALTPVTAVIEAIPDPVLAGATAFVLFSRAIASMVTALGPAAVGLGALGPVLAGIAAITIGVTSAIGNHNKAKAEERQLSLALADALLDETTARRTSLTTTTEQEIKARGLTDEMGRLGITYQQLTDAALGDAAAQAQVAQAFRDNTGAATVVNGSLQSVASTVGDLTARFQAGAKAALDDAVAKGQVTAESARAAEASNRLKDGTTNYLAVLQTLLPEQADLITKHGDAATAADRQEQEELQLAEAINRVIDVTLELTNKELANERARLALRDTTARLTEAQENLTDKQNSGTASTRDLEEAQRRLDGAELSQREAAIRAASAQAELANQQVNTSDTAEAARQRQANLKQAFNDVASTLAPGSPLRAHLEQLADRVAGLPDRNLLITADADQALNAAGAVTGSLNSLDGRVVSSTVLVNTIGTGVDAFQSGGHLGPGQVGLTGEAGPELIVGGRGGTTIISHERSIDLLQRLVGQQAASFGQLASALRGGATIGPVIVNEVAQDARATAFAVTAELGRLAER